MKLEEFNNLTFDDHLFKVVDEGTFLENFKTKDISMNLYSLSSFYIELIYNSELNKVDEIRSFKSGIRMDKYTRNIDLTSKS